ncbi:hypothetical protein GGI20_003426 [Coemansia sp. BCRC 34301]|nr:hypothetical protein GGI20_003426 [Coemansia sp. BCRC 34301]
MFSAHASGTAGPVRAAKRNCPVCGTRRMGSREDGRVMCKNGHEQAGVVEEETENIIEGSTRRRVKTGIARFNRRREARERRLYGAPARFMFVEAFQLILKAQVTALVRNHGAPEALIGVVQNLWLLYVSKIPNLDKTAEDDFAAQDYAMNSLDQSAQSRNRACTLLADALFTQHTQSQRFEPADDSLDIMLRRVDEDIARDEEEMLEWDREFRLGDTDEPGATRDDDNDEDSDYSAGNEEGVPAENMRDSKRLPSKMFAISLERVKRYPKIEYLPVFLYIGYRFLRMPVLCADLFRLLANDRVPYVSAYHSLPEHIHERVGHGYSLLLTPTFAPSTTRIMFLSSVFDEFFAKHYSIKAPLTDIPSMLLSLIKRLGLGIEFYSLVMRLLELISVQPNQYIQREHRPEVILISAIVIVLKLHYGLDEVERHPPHDAPYRALNLPSLRDFLDKWRSDWEAELTIGILPHLTAFGEEWEAAFADNCRRLMAKRTLGPRHRAHKEISTKYRRMLESLATEGGMSAEQARQALPPEYGKRLLSSEPVLTQTQSSTQIADPTTATTTTISDVSRYVQPIILPKTDCSSSTKRPPYTPVEPFYNHPEIQLEPGECYALFTSYKSMVYVPGYMVPILGLIYARCAAIVGCSQTTLSQRIGMLERKMKEAVTRSRVYKNKANRSQFQQ